MPDQRAHYVCHRCGFRNDPWDHDGLGWSYILEDLPVGLYTIAVSYVGHEDQARYEIQVSSGRPVILDFQLEEQTTQLEEVVVKASPFKRTEEPIVARTIGVAGLGGNRISPR